MPGMQSSTIFPGPGSQSPGCPPLQPQWPPRCGNCDLNSRMMECRPLVEHFSRFPQSEPSLATNRPRSGRRGQRLSLNVSSKLGWLQPGTNCLPLLGETPLRRSRTWSIFDHFRNTLPWGPLYTSCFLWAEMSMPMRPRIFGSLGPQHKHYYVLGAVRI